MRIAIVGQRDFGKAVLEAFLARRDTVAGVFCAPDRPGAANDPLKAAAEAGAVPVFQLDSLRGERARTILRGLQVDLAVMAYVLQFVPEDFTAIPTYGTSSITRRSCLGIAAPVPSTGPLFLAKRRPGSPFFAPQMAWTKGR